MLLNTTPGSGVVKTTFLATVGVACTVLLLTEASGFVTACFVENLAGATTDSAATSGRGLLTTGNAALWEFQTGGFSTVGGFCTGFLLTDPGGFVTTGVCNNLICGRAGAIVADGSGLFTTGLATLLDVCTACFSTIPCFGAFGSCSTKTSGFVAGRVVTDACFDSTFATGTSRQVLLTLVDTTGLEAGTGWLATACIVGTGGLGFAGARGFVTGRVVEQSVFDGTDTTTTAWSVLLTIVLTVGLESETTHLAAICIHFAGNAFAGAGGFVTGRVVDDFAAGATFSAATGWADFLTIGNCTHLEINTACFPTVCGFGTDTRFAKSRSLITLRVLNDFCACATFATDTGGLFLFAVEKSAGVDIGTSGRTAA